MTWIVRVAPLRLIPFWKSVAAVAEGELNISVPTIWLPWVEPQINVPVPLLTLTVSGPPTAAKPPPLRRPVELVRARGAV